ncbi:MAG: hypothetical protein ACUVRK_05450 [Spirochaetota bacterium]
MNETAIIVSFSNTIHDVNIRNYLTPLNKKREEEEKNIRKNLKNSKTTIPLILMPIMIHKKTITMQIAKTVILIARITILKNDELRLRCFHNS